MVLKTDLMFLQNFTQLERISDADFDCEANRIFIRKMSLKLQGYLHEKYDVDRVIKKLRELDKRSVHGQAI